MPAIIDIGSAFASGFARRILTACFGMIAIGFAGAAKAQAYGLATMAPGTLAHTSSSAIAKVLKEKAGLNVLVQPTAGESVLIPIVAKGEIDFGIAHILEVISAVEGSGSVNKQTDLRLLGPIFPLRVAFFVRKDSDMKTAADLKGKRVVMGFSAQRTLDTLQTAMLATVGLTPNDMKPVLVPNVIRGADDFIAGAADDFFFAFGAPKVRETDASVGGIRALALSDTQPAIDASRKVFPYGYMSEVKPGPVFVGVQQPMKVYTVDYMMFTNAKVKDEIVYKVLDTMAQYKADMAAVAPNLNEFSPSDLNKKYNLPYHPGALKYFKDKNIEAKAFQ
jgi:hypothetical protein